MLLVLHQGAIGDFLLALSVAEAARRCLAPAGMEVIASSPAARWASDGGRAWAHVSPEAVGLHPLFHPDAPLDPRLFDRLRRAACVLSFLGGPDEPPHRRLRAETRAPTICVDPRPTPGTLAAGRHITEQWSDALRAAGLPVGPPVPPRIPPAEKNGTGLPRRKPPAAMIHGFPAVGTGTRRPPDARSPGRCVRPGLHAENKTTAPGRHQE